VDVRTSINSHLVKYVAEVQDTKLWQYISCNVLVTARNSIQRAGWCSVWQLSSMHLRNKRLLGAFFDSVCGMLTRTPQ